MSILNDPLSTSGPQIPFSPLPGLGGGTLPLESGPIDRFARILETLRETTPDDNEIFNRGVNELRDSLEKPGIDKTAPVEKDEDSRLFQVRKRIARSQAEIEARRDIRFDEAPQAERLKIFNDRLRFYGLPTETSIKGEKGLAEGLGAFASTDVIPFVGVGLDTIDLFKVFAATKRAEEDNASVEDLELMAEFQEGLADDLRGSNFLGGVAQGVADLVPFGVQFFASGGLANVVKTGGRKLLTGRIGRKISSLVEQMARAKLGRLAVGKAVKGTLGLAGTSALRMPAFAPNIAKDTLDAMVPGYRFTAEDGRAMKLIVNGPAAPFFQAFRDGLTKNAIEIFTEGTGPGINLVGRSLGRGAAKGLAPLVQVANNRLPSFVMRAKTAIAAQLMRQDPLRFPSFAKTVDFLAKSGYNFPAAEIGEERMNQLFLKVIKEVIELTGGETTLEPGAFPTVRSLAQESVVFTTPLVGTLGMSALMDRRGMPIIPQERPTPPGAASIIRTAKAIGIEDAEMKNADQVVRQVASRLSGKLPRAQGEFGEIIQKRRETFRKEMLSFIEAAKSLGVQNTRSKSLGQIAEGAAKIIKEPVSTQDKDFFKTGKAWLKMFVDLEGLDQEFANNTSSPASQDLRRQYVELLNLSKPIRLNVRRGRHKALKKIAAKVGGIQESVSGRAANIQVAGARKGKIIVPAFEPFLDKIGEFGMNQLIDHVNRHERLQPLDRARMAEAIEDSITSGKLPTLGEIKGIQDALGVPLGNAFMNKFTISQQLMNAASSVMSATRSIKSAFDMSAVGRQGHMGFVMHPVESAKATARMMKAMATPQGAEYAAELDARMRFGDAAELRELAGLDLTTLGGSLSSREEMFRSDFGEIASRVRVRGPGSALIRLLGEGVKISERGFVTFLNQQRSTMFDYWADRLRKAGIDPNTDKGLAEFQRLAKTINAYTGRGNISTEAVGEIGNSLLWSPKFAVSRFEAPFRTAQNLARFRQDPVLMRMALRSLVAESTAYMGVAAMAAMAAEAFDLDIEVGLDWLSSDFMKIRHGDTRIDLGAGMGQVIRLIANLISLKSESTRRPGSTRTTDPINTVARFAAFKASPFPATAISVLKREFTDGSPISPEGLAESLFSPISLETLGDVVREHGAQGMFLMIPEVFGMGVNVHRFDESNTTREQAYTRAFLTAGRKGVQNRKKFDQAIRAGAGVLTTMLDFKDSAAGREEIGPLGQDLQDRIQRILDKQGLNGFSPLENGAKATYGEDFARRLKLVRGEPKFQRRLLQIQGTEDRLKRVRKHFAAAGAAINALSGPTGGLNRKDHPSFDQVEAERQRQAIYLRALDVDFDLAERIFRARWGGKGLTDAFVDRLIRLRRVLNPAEKLPDTSAP